MTTVPTRSLAKHLLCVSLLFLSGSGKTTLLNVLAGHSSSSLRTSGSLLLNGLEVFGMSLGGLVGYVQQEDLFVGTLTVHEHLRFQVRREKSCLLRRHFFHKGFSTYEI